jgi:hypothetical protein
LGIGTNPVRYQFFIDYRETVMFRTLLLFAASILMLGFSTGCDGNTDPVTRTDRPAGLSRAAGGGATGQDKNGEKTPPGGVIEIK